VERRSIVVIHNKSRHCIRRRNLRGQSRHPSMGKYTSQRMAKHRFDVLGVCDNSTAYFAHNRKPHRRLVDSRANAFLVSGGGLHRHSRADSHLFILHPDNGEVDGYGRSARYRCPGCPFAMVVLKQWASRTYAGRLACSLEGIIPDEAGQLTTVPGGHAEARR